MADIILTTRVKEKQADGTQRVVEACLLVYDDEYFSPEALSNDFREYLETSPSTDAVYVVAPRVTSKDFTLSVLDCSAISRVGLHDSPEYPMIRLLTIEKDIENSGYSLQETIINSIEGVSVKSKGKINPELIQGWLCDLFRENGGLITAPPGIHFGKTSGKHSEKFLRASNVLISSASCRLIALTLIPLLPTRAIRQLYVDTSAILPIGFALEELSRIHGTALVTGKVKSFSSYFGINNKDDFRQSDLILISSSTSGGLASLLQNKKAEVSNIVTLFYLQAKGWQRSIGMILCDLTYKEERQFGYEAIPSFKHDECPLCKEGILLAEFEGDQFLLQKRKTKRLKITKASQSQSARLFFEAITKKKAISVDIQGSTRSRYPDIIFNSVQLATSTRDESNLIKFKLRHSIPSPLHLVITPPDIKKSDVISWCTVNESQGITEETEMTNTKGLEEHAKIENAGVLVLFSTLNEELYAREINRTLRTTAPKGIVSYFAILHVIESPEARRDLSSFLKYGERGANTFRFESCFSIQISQRQDRSPWRLEYDYISRIAEKLGTLPTELSERLRFLSDTAKSEESLFLPGQNSVLNIANDFVYLNTDSNKEKISQADIYAIVSNLLTCCRNGNREFDNPVPRGIDQALWSNSVYGQTLLCPRNFKDFNDGILHAAILRAAKASELRYDTDDELSEEMLEILLSEVDGWRLGSGQALGEFILSIATGRLTIRRNHYEALQKAIKLSSHIPEWIKHLLSE